MAGAALAIGGVVADAITGDAAVASSVLKVGDFSSFWWCARQPSMEPIRAQECSGHPRRTARYNNLILINPVKKGSILHQHQFWLIPAYRLGASPRHAGWGRPRDLPTFKSASPVVPCLGAAPL